MNTRFLTARAWLDEDGKHVWFSHECLDGRETAMMPYPKWHASEDGKRAEPSFDCRLCGCHTVQELGPVPPEWMIGATSTGVEPK